MVNEPKIIHATGKFEYFFIEPISRFYREGDGYLSKDNQTIWKKIYMFFF